MKGMNRQHITFNVANGQYLVKGRCVYCEEPQVIEVPDIDSKGFHNWWKGQEGINIQDALPHVSAEERELLISGVCPKCWDAMFKEV